MSLVSLIKANGDIEGPKKAIEKAIERIHFKINSEAKSIVIKPNLCYYWDYSTGHTTDPRFVATLIDVLRKRIPDAEVSVAEADASSMKCRCAYKILGYEKMAKEKEIELVNLTEDETVESKTKVNNQEYKFRIPKTVVNADIFINVPKIKYMSGTLMTCCLKNVFGCNPFPKKFRYHSKLNEVIVALNKLMPSDICIIDGMVVSGRHPLRLGLVMASTDPVALDAVAARILGFDPKKIKHIVLAEKEGVGKMRSTLVGDRLQYFTERFPRKTASDKIQVSLVRPMFALYKKMVE
ncbi:MAG: DUF362 domain-containing protein [Candidatus Bathyarchaeia archaeon]